MDHGDFGSYLENSRPLFFDKVSHVIGSYLNLISYVVCTIIFILWYYDSTSKL